MIGSRQGRLSRLAAALGLALLAPLAAAAGIQQAFLVQNSGWMEPFYADPASGLKGVVAAVAGAVAGPQDPVLVLAFNQATPQNVSPALLSSARGAGGVAAALAPLQVATKAPHSGLLADTDFREAVVRTIGGQFKQQPGIVWIFTNNRNSPNNDQHTADRNRDFYNLVHLESSITRSVAFAKPMKVHGKLYQANGLMVYALAYGDEAGQALARIVDGGAVAAVLGGTAARLKPLDRDAVRILPSGVKGSPNVHASLGADKRTLLFDIDASSLVPTIVLQAALQNQFYPYVISTADVSAQIATGHQHAVVDVVPAQIRNLVPQASEPVEVRLPLPLARIPSTWSAQAMGAMGKRVQLPAVVQITLSNQTLALPPEFKSDFSALFPGDPLPDVFQPPDTVHNSVANVPIVLRIQYPLAPLIAVMLSALLLCGLAATLAVLAGRPRRFAVEIDGVRRHMTIKPLSRVQVVDDRGAAVGSLKRGLFGVSVAHVEPGRLLTVRPAK